MIKCQNYQVQSQGYQIKKINNIELTSLTQSKPPIKYSLIRVRPYFAKKPQQALNDSYQQLYQIQYCFSSVSNDISHSSILNQPSLCMNSQSYMEIMYSSVYLIQKEFLQIQEEELLYGSFCIERKRRASDQELQLNKENFVSTPQKKKFILL